jgi:D-serine deaminase-like pyridoxal phosphate-dependent protein
MSDWFTVANVESIASPALLIHIDRVRENIRRMIGIVGDVNRLRPHIKTHKLAEIVRMQSELGITKVKCATIAEAEMAGEAAAPDVLLAYQPVGPNVRRVIQLVKSFPRTRFSAVVDDVDAIGALSRAMESNSTRLDVFLEIDCGQHRTGVEPGPKAVELYRVIASSPGLNAAGLHAYDGHIHDRDPTARARLCEEAYVAVATLRQNLLREGLSVPRVVVGGTPTFPMHARRPEVECSPGTCVLWDAGYAANLPDLEFLPSAVLLSRIISRPGTNRLCLDLGHKAVASEMQQPRVQFLNLPDARIVGHNEEHMVVETPAASHYKVGDCIYALPWHVCPTVALHGEAVAIDAGVEKSRWKTRARERRLNI